MGGAGGWRGDSKERFQGVLISEHGTATRRACVVEKGGGPNGIRTRVSVRSRFRPRFSPLQRQGPCRKRQGSNTQHPKAQNRCVQEERCSHRHASGNREPRSEPYGEPVSIVASRRFDRWATANVALAAIVGRWVTSRPTEPSRFTLPAPLVNLASVATLERRPPQEPWAQPTSSACRRRSTTSARDTDGGRDRERRRLTLCESPP